MTYLQGITDLFRDSPLPESLKLLAEYRQSGRNLIRTYADAPVLWCESGEGREDPRMELVRGTCLASLEPLINESFCKRDLPVSVLS